MAGWDGFARERGMGDCEGLSPQLVSYYIVPQMWNRMLGALWRVLPKRARRWGVKLIEPRFMVTAGAVILDERNRVLLLDHVFRAGSGWGIPGGFIEKGEQPEDALRRELREEIGLELKDTELAFVRTLRKPAQIEIIFRCRALGTPGRESAEIKGLRWCDLDNLPAELSSDQCKLIKRAVGVGATDAE